MRKDFKEIGVGKPLNIEIATGYTREYKKFLGDRKDVIVVSGVKNSQTFQGTSRAINIKSEKVNEKKYLKQKLLEDIELQLKKSFCLLQKKKCPSGNILWPHQKKT